MAEILLLEDDETTSFLIHKALEAEHTITSSSSLEQVRRVLEGRQYDLILLDVILPDGDGFEFYSQIKNLPALRKVPVVFLTSRSSVADQILGLSLGAEDYLVKPVNPLLLLARVNAKLKKYQQSKEQLDVNFLGDIKIILSKQQVFLVGRDVETEILLTPLEFKLLIYFARHEGHVLTRNQIITNVWGEAVHVYDRTIDTHVFYIRKKLMKSLCTVSSVHGVGYRFAVSKSKKDEET